MNTKHTAGITNKPYALCGRLRNSTYHVRFSMRICDFKPIHSNEIDRIHTVDSQFLEPILCFFIFLFRDRGISFAPRVFFNLAKPFCLQSWFIFRFFLPFNFICDNSGSWMAYYFCIKEYSPLKKELIQPNQTFRKLPSSR